MTGLRWIEVLVMISYTEIALGAGMALVFAVSAGVAAPTPDAEIRVSRTRLEQKPGAEPVRPVCSVANRYNRFVAKLTSDGWERGAFPPIHSILDSNVTFTPAPAKTSYAIEPFVVERSYAWDNGLAGKSYWFCSPDSALAVALFRLENKGEQPVTLTVGQSAVLRVGNPNCPQPVSIAEREYGLAGAGFRVSNVEFPDLFCRLRTNLPGEPVILNSETGKPARLHEKAKLSYRQEGAITLGPGESGDYWLMLTGGRTGDYTFSFEPSTELAVRELAKLREWQAERLRQAPQLTTPDEEVNALFDWFKIAPWRCSYDIHLGKPYSMTTRDNERVRVLCPTFESAYDYYGIWANDTVETLWEYGCLGREFYPVMANTIEVFYQRGIPESAELPLPTGLPWHNTGDFGQHGQWVNAAAQYLLWTGDRNEFDRIWPQIRQVLAELPEKRDKDGDMLDDTLVNESFKVSFPEQLALGEYNHELLYQNCFWYGGFDAAVKVAKLFGRESEAAELAAQRDRLGASINAKFGTDYGYASWLDGDHKPHPHKGHNQTFAVEYGIAPPEMAEKVFANQLSAPVLTEYGPRVSDIPTGAASVFETCAWSYNRWSLNYAMFRYGKTDQAVELMRKWAAQEANSICHYQGSEFWPEEGLPGSGLVWTCGRAIRAMVFGLAGLRLEGEGVGFDPRLPSAWPGFELRNLEVRGSVLDLTVKRGEQRSVTVNGREQKDGLIPNAMLGKGRRYRVEVTVGKG